MANSSCPSIESFINNQSLNICAFPGVSSNSPIKAALTTCCGASNTFESDNDCFVYCGIETVSDVLMLSNCMADQIGLKSYLEDPSIASQSCFDEIGATTRTALPTNKIATTWPWPSEAATHTFMESSEPVLTVTYDSSFFQEVSLAYASQSDLFLVADDETSSGSETRPTLTGTGPSRTGVSESGPLTTTTSEITSTPISAGAITSTGTGAAVSPTTSASSATLSRTHTSLSTLAVAGLLLFGALI